MREGDGGPPTTVDPPGRVHTWRSDRGRPVETVRPGPRDNDDGGTSDSRTLVNDRGLNARKRDGSERRMNDGRTTASRPEIPEKN